MTTTTIAPIIGLDLSQPCGLRVQGIDFVLEFRQWDEDELPGELSFYIGYNQSEYLFEWEQTWVTITQDLSPPEAHQQSIQALSSLLSGIRLLQESRFWCPIIWTDTEAPERRTTSDRLEYRQSSLHVSSYADRWEAVDAASLDDRTVLGGRQLEKLPRICDLLEQLPAEPRLHEALRRFNMALDRSRPEDAIIDLCIALEAVLSTDVTNGRRGSHLEGKAKLLLSKADQGYREVNIADGYWVRNQIVHGTGKSLDAKVTMRALAEATRGVLRAIVEKPELLQLTAGLDE